jgi:4'-phosphopantetheinyl transferase
VPAEVQLTADSRGKLRLGGAETQWEFNLSHSGSYVLVALAWGRDVGVDVETIKPDFPVDVATRFFAPDELTQLNSLPTHERARAFYALWTCKEAVLKAHGMGLSIPLSSFSVTAFSSPSPSLVRWADDLKPELTWRLWSLALDAAHLGALAVRHDPTEATVRLFYCDNLPTEPLGEH